MTTRIGMIDKAMPAKGPTWPVILGGVLLAVVAGAAVATGGLLLVAAGLALCAVVLLASLLPEFPIVVLVAGMPLWLLIPESVQPITDGLAVPLTLAAAILSLAWHRLLHGQTLLHWPKPHAEDGWLLAFAAWLALSLLWTSNVPYGLQKVLGFTAYTVVGYFIIRWSYHPRHFSIERLAWMIVGAGLMHTAVMVAIVAPVGAWRPDAALSYRFWKLHTQWGLDEVSESIALLYGILATWWLWRLPGKRRRWPVKVFLALALLAQLWALLGHQQRSASLVLILTAFFILVYRPGQRSLLAMLLSKRVWWVVVPLVVVLGMLFFALNPDWDIANLGKEVNVVSRLRSYNYALDVFTRYPLFGVGIGGTADPYARAVATDQRGFNWFYVHNRVLEVLAEAGLVGLTLLVGFTLTVLLRFYRIVRGGYTLAGSMALLGLVAFLQQWAIAMFSTDLLTWNVGIWAAIVVEMHDWRRVLG